MRNIFFSLIFSMSIISANTLIVDNNPECSMSFFGKCLQWKDCTGSTNFKRTIKDALDNVNDGDTIKICPSEYKENDLTIDNNNLTIQSTSGERDDVNITNEDISSKKNIFRLPNSVNNLTIQDLSIYQYASSHSGIYSSTHIKDINFTNLYIYSKGRGVYESDSIENVEFKLLNIESSKQAIYFKGIIGNIHFQDFNISVSSDVSAVRLKKKANIIIDTNVKDFNYLKSAKYGLDIEKGNVIIKNSKIETDQYAIYLRNSIGDFTLYNSNIDSKGRGLYAIKISNDANISNNTITIDNNDNDGIYIKTVSGKTYIYNNAITNGNYGIRINDGEDGGNIKNNIIKDASIYGLKLLSSKKVRSFEVINNCFESGSGKNIESKDKDGVFDDGSSGNYWDDWSGSGNYKVPTIPKYDHYPLSSCDLNPNHHDHLIVNYQMDECSWDGTTGDVKDSSSKGNDATSGNDANTTDGKLCRAGDINATNTEDKYILTENGISLPEVYSLTVWIKFPLNEDGHKTFGSGSSSSQYFNIADVPGSDEDYIYFRKKSSTWNLCIYGDAYQCKSYNPQNLSGWHQLVFSVTENGTKFYVDADKKLDFDQHANRVSLGLLFNSDYDASSDNSANGQSIGSIVDEFKIFSKELTSSEISTIYDNEDAGKNYDGTERSCNHCGGGNNTDKSSLFNAVDLVNGTCNAVNNWDDNITTKIVNDNINLSILAKEDNSSVQAVIDKVSLYLYASYDSNNKCTGNYKIKTICGDNGNCGTTDSSGCLTLNNDNSNNENNYDKAKKCVVVHIEGRDSNNTSSDNNESNSSDNFAIRPEKFILDLPAKAYAGEDFNISSIHAVDKDDNDANDYNETFSNANFSPEDNNTACITGDLNVSNFSFENGESQNILTNYSKDIGDINITVHEINGSEFAYIDRDDTKEDMVRLIKSDTETIDIDPYDINITNINFDISTGYNWLYMSKDIRDMNITLNLSIGVFDKQGEQLKDFNSTCYGHDINTTFAYDVNRSDDLNLTLDGNLTSLDTNISDVNKTLQIPVTLFNGNNGEANSSYDFGIDRLYDAEKNVTFIQLKEVNITTAKLAKNENNYTATPDQNATFYYARLYPQDLSTSEINDTTTAKILIYNSKQLDDFKEELLHWYIYTPHKESDGNITQFITSRSTDKSSSNEDSIEATQSSYGSGIFIIEVKNENGNEDTHYIHLDTQNFLWYVPSGFGTDYSYDTNSNCSQHPCIEYKYGTNTEGTGVNSGSTSGVSFELNTSKNSRGVRLYR